MMNRQDSMREPAHRLSVSNGIVMLSMLVIFSATSGFAQYQVRKPATSRQLKASISVTEPVGGAVWEKGKRYTIKWKSEGRVPSVKIVLIDQTNKSHDVVRSTTNSGSYSYTVSTRLADGGYKVAVMTADGSVRGETGGTVTIQNKSFGTTARKSIPASGGTAEQPESPAIGQRALSGATRPSGLSGQSVTQQGGIQPGDLTATKDEDNESPGLADFQVGSTSGLNVATTSVVVGNLPVTQVSAAEGTELDLSLLQPVEEPEISDSGPNPITILEPQKDDVWVPGGQYAIEWSSEGVTGPFDVILMRERRNDVRLEIPILSGAQASGSFVYSVPLSAPLGHKWEVRVQQVEGPRGRDSDQFSIWVEQPIDLTLEIENPKTNYFRTGHLSRDHYAFNRGSTRWLEFDIAVINNGTRSPIMVPILVRLVKGPENVVIHQMQAGFADVFSGSWYMTNGPIYWDVRQLEENYTNQGQGGIDFNGGWYDVYVTADYSNSLGERDELQDDNIDDYHIYIY